jgi:hypothetical protein
MLSVDDEQIESLRVSHIGLEESIDTRKQPEEFASFQYSQGTQRAYLAESSEMAYNGWNRHGE